MDGWLAISDEFLGKLQQEQNILNLEMRDMDVCRKNGKAGVEDVPRNLHISYFKERKTEETCPGATWGCPEVSRTSRVLVECCQIAPLWRESKAPKSTSRAPFILLLIEFWAWKYVLLPTPCNPITIGTFKALFIRYVGVVWFFFMFSNIPSIGFTRRNSYYFSKSMMKHMQNRLRIGPP